MAFHRGDSEPTFFSPFDAELVDVTTGGAVEILNIFLFVLLDELLEAVVMGLECGLGDFVAACVDVYLFGSTQIEGFEVVSHWSVFLKPFACGS